MSPDLAIDARQLTRRFGDKVAVADATFQVTPRRLQTLALKDVIDFMNDDR